MFSGHKIFSSRYLTLSLSLRFSVFLASYYIYLVYLSTKRYTQHTYTYTHIRTLFPSSLSPSRCARVYCVWCDFSSMCVSRSRSVTRGLYVLFVLACLIVYAVLHSIYTQNSVLRARTLSLSQTPTQTQTQILDVCLCCVSVCLMRSVRMSACTDIHGNSWYQCLLSPSLPSIHLPFPSLKRNAPFRNIVSECVSSEYM